MASDILHRVKRNGFRYSFAILDERHMMIFAIRSAELRPRERQPAIIDRHARSIGKRFQLAPVMLFKSGDKTASPARPEI